MNTVFSQGRMMALGMLFAFALLVIGSGCSKESRKVRHLQRADSYFQATKYAEAEIEYLNALRLDGQSLAAIRRLGIIYHDQGRIPQAFMFLLKARELDPNDVEARLRLGLLHLSVRGFDEARKEAMEVLKRQPRTGEGLLLLVDTVRTDKQIAETRDFLKGLGEDVRREAEYDVALGSLALRQKDYAGAESAFKSAMNRHPNSSAVHVALGNLYWTQNDLKSAETAFQKAAELAPPRSPRRLQFADFKLKTGDVEAARRSLEEIASAVPDYLPAWIRLAEVSFAERKYDECNGFTKRVLARDPVNYDALMLNGRIKLAQGEGAVAAADLDRVIKLYPRAPMAYHQIAVAHLLNKDAGKAAAALGQALSLDPELAEAVVLLAEINLRRGDALPAIQSLTPLIRKRPEIVQAHVLLADAYRARGELDSAQAVYGRMKELFPKAPQPWLFSGLLLVQQRNRVDARQAFEKALTLAPDYLPAMEQLIELELEEKRHESARMRVNGYLERAPAMPALHLLSARVFVEQKETDQAETELLKAIQLDPRFRAAYFMLANLYVASNRQRDALQRLEEVTTKNPKDVPAFMQIAMIYDQLGNVDAARQTYERLLAIDRDFSPALNNLAYLYSERLGQLDKAYELARRARNLLPRDPYSADTLGWILNQRGEYAWALNLLQESAEKLPTAAEVLFHLGMTHYMMGEEGPARMVLERALQTRRDFPGRDQAQKRLAVLTLDLASAGIDARAMLQKQLDESPDDPIILARLATFYERSREPRKAADAWGRVISRNPRNVMATIALARLHVEQFQDFKRALELARGARDLAPEDPTILHLLGRIAFRAGDYKWALSLLQESARKLPSYAPVAYDLGWAHYGVGNLNAADSAMQAALKAAPDFPGAEDARLFVELAELYRKPDKAALALQRMEEKLKATPDYVPALMVVGAGQEWQGNYGAARQSYEQALKRFPDSSLVWKNLASLLVEKLADYKSAYDYAMKAREALPEDAEVAKSLGITLYRRGDYSRSIALLREASKKRPADFELQFYLAMAHGQRNEHREGREALQLALSKGAGSKLAEEARRILGDPK